MIFFSANGVQTANQLIKRVAVMERKRIPVAFPIAPNDLMRPTSFAHLATQA
jgi:hypothetical protein